MMWQPVVQRDLQHHPALSSLAPSRSSIGTVLSWIPYSVIGAIIKVKPLPAALRNVGKTAFEGHKAGMVPAHSEPEDRTPCIRQQLYDCVLPTMPGRRNPLSPCLSLWLRRSGC